MTDSKIDFMKYRRFFVIVSLTLLVVGAIELMIDGLNLGIDFAGGTQKTVRTTDPVAIDDLRDELANAGLADFQLQQFGNAAEQEFLIKTPVVEGSEEGSTEIMMAALNRALNPDSDAFDLNQRGTEALAELLYDADPDGLQSGDPAADAIAGGARSVYRELATAVMEVRKANKVISSYDQLADVDMSEAARQTIQSQTQLGSFAVLSTENVGPQIGEELRNKGLWAVALSLIGMLLYIWFRFELRFGVGALVAVFHDFTIVLGIYALVGYEFNLSTIAAFLTLVGYSVNDTVVIFDRVRENMRRSRRKPLVDIMNESINQTLSRTILTSGTTLLAVGCLYLFGGEVIRGFSFVLLIGVVIGTYSSVFVASPFALLWEQLTGDRSQKKTTPQNA
ncbi:MAG: protein translocase subunit SecF [Acidobacteriota bacterium]